MFAIAVLTLAVSFLALGQAQSKKMVAKNAVDTSTPHIVSQRTADADVAKAVIEMTKAEWASEIRDPSNLAEQAKDMADDYTEFRPEYPTPLEGKNQYVRINTATGKPVKVSGVSFARYEGGKLIEELVYFDALEFLSQLGLIEPPKLAAAG